jgi:CheY-like chemotaxis protein
VLVIDAGFGEDVLRGVADEARRAGVARNLVLLSPFDRREFGPPAAAGFDGYLVKPVRTESFLRQLTEPGSAAAPRPAELRRSRPRREAGSAPRVLLAEDNEINALLALRSLEKLGAVPDWAKNGEEALALAEGSLSDERSPYRLVLMDIRMPGLDGMEATRRLRQREAALGVARPLRVIALTANIRRSDEPSLRAAGFDGFLPKPFELAALEALLKEADAPLRKAS